MPSGSKPTSPTMVPSSAGGLFRKGMDADRSIAMTGETAADLTAAGATVGAKPEPEIENMESCHASGGRQQAARRLALFCSDDSRCACKAPP